MPILGSSFWTGFSGTTGSTFNNQDIENSNFSTTTIDVTSPTANLNAANIIVNNSRTHTFSVTYSDDNAGNPVNTKQPGYANLLGANDFYTTVGLSVKAPTYAIRHIGGVSAIVMGDFYRRTTFPDIYRDALFFNDVHSGTIDAIVFNLTGGIASVQRFATGLAYVVEMKTGPDSNLYYVNLTGGTIGRWRYTG